jgi:hypothetical protein
MALNIFAKPDGGRDRWVPVVFLRVRSELYPPGLLTSIAVTAFFLWFGGVNSEGQKKSFTDLI